MLPGYTQAQNRQGADRLRGLERHHPKAVGVHDAHDAGKLCLSLEGKANPRPVSHSPLSLWT